MEIGMFFGLRGYAGVYRKENVIISGARHIPPDAVQIQSQMEQLADWYELEGKELHPIERASIIHIGFGANVRYVSATRIDN